MQVCSDLWTYTYCRPPFQGVSVWEMQFVTLGQTSRLGGQLAVLWRLCSNSKSTTGAKSTVPLQNNLIISSSDFVSIFSAPQLSRTLSCLLCEPWRHYVTVCTYMGGLEKLIYLSLQQGLWGPSAVGLTQLTALSLTSICYKNLWHLLMLIPPARRDWGRTGIQTKWDGTSKQRLLYKVFCCANFNI